MSDRRPSSPGDSDPDETHLVDTGPGQLPDRSGERQWSDLRILDEIGRGGFGRVYRAWDETLAREVALKIIKPQDEAHRANVLREGQMLARVKHPNVVTVFRAQQAGDEVGITMELIKGRDLSDVVSHGGPMGAAEASVVGIHLCQALAAVHAAGVLHRDVKARNVMRESGGRIVLMDFGAGRELVAKAQSTRPLSDLSGTPLYLAPELFAGGQASPASDLYSLGVLLFYLVTRKYPVEATNLSELVLKHSAGERRLLSDVRPDLPAAFVHVVHRALSARPEQRQGSAGALMAELSQAMPGIARGIEGADGPPLPQPVVYPRARAAGSIARLAMAATAAIGALIVLGVLTTAHYDRALGRAGFSDAGLATWLEFGVRSVFPLVVLTSAVFLLWRLASAAWSLTKRFVPPVQRAADLARTSISGRLVRMAPDGSAMALGLLVVQVLLLAGWAWAFWPMLTNLPTLFVNTADASALALLNPDGGNGLLYGYRSMMTPWLALISFGWYWLLLRSPARGSVPRPTAALGVGLVILELLLLEVPYRLFYKSEGIQVTHAGRRCYEIGARGPESLLYCPDLPKLQRLPIVKSAELQDKASAQMIFTSPGPGPGKN